MDEHTPVSFPAFFDEKDFNIGQHIEAALAEMSFTAIDNLSTGGNCDGRKGERQLHGDDLPSNNVRLFEEPSALMGQDGRSKRDVHELSNDLSNISMGSMVMALEEAQLDSSHNSNISASKRTLTEEPSSLFLDETISECTQNQLGRHISNVVKELPRTFDALLNNELDKDQEIAVALDLDLDGSLYEYAHGRPRDSKELSDSPASHPLHTLSAELAKTKQDRQIQAVQLRQYKELLREIQSQKKSNFHKPRSSAALPDILAPLSTLKEKLATLKLNISQDTVSWYDKIDSEVDKELARQTRLRTILASIQRYCNVKTTTQ